MDIELKACPFCGSEAKVVKTKGEYFIQCTNAGNCYGHHDRNGKEIYEGDVVEFYVPQAGMNHKQRFTHEIKWDDKRTGYDTQWFNGWEVIGNVFENPELVK